MALNEYRNSVWGGLPGSCLEGLLEFWQTWCVSVHWCLIAILERDLQREKSRQLQWRNVCICVYTGDIQETEDKIHDHDQASNIIIQL